jgi:phosphoribosylglycinamide formyltransferase-1
MTNNKIAVMASGKGSNLRAILDEIKQGTCLAEIEVVICNKADAGALAIAREAGVPQVLFINPKDYGGRESYDLVCAKEIKNAGCQWVVLAGYMRILSAFFIQAFHNRIINIHPSLLPAFVGGDAVGDALKHGVKVSGCTVHLVSEALDSGPILAQSSVPVMDEDDWSLLHQRIQIEEYKLYPQVIHRLVSEPFKVSGRKVCW